MLMVAYFFLAFGLDAALMMRRMSFLTDAISFRVGIRSSIFRLAFSMRGSQ